MPQSWKIFTRDVRRLAAVRKVWIILIGLMIIPALYSWLNVAAFWDPYGNTQNIKISVVNQDKGGSSDVTGHLDVGQQIVTQIKENDQLGWQIKDAAAAEHDLRRGDTYATITIPEDFTADLLSMVNGTFTKPALKYEVNEKDSAIAPKMTDAGATGMDTQITSSFKEQVATAATTAVSDEGKSLEDAILDTRDRSNNTLGETTRNLDTARQRIGEMQGKLAEAQTSMSGAKETVGKVDRALVEAQGALGQVQDIVKNLQGEITTFTDQTTSAFVDGATAAAEGTARAKSSVADINTTLQDASGRLDSAERTTQSVIDRGDQAIADLRSLLNNSAIAPDVAGPLQDAIDGLESGNAANRELVGDLGALNRDTSATADSVNSAAEAVDNAAAETRNTSQALRDAVSENVPALNGALSRLNSTIGAFSGSLESQRSTLREANGLIDGVVQQLGATRATMGNFDTSLASLQEGLDGIRNDINALTATSNSQALQTITGLDAEDVGQFFAEPVKINSEPVYAMNSYGSGMASLFTNLTLWIGAFMLMVLFRMEVDREGFSRLNVRQAYTGRFLLMAAFAAIQGVVVTVGNLLIGVQAVNPFIYVGTGVLIGMAYLSIIYALISAFGHFGRFLAVVLVIIQIPGASGIYPIELMPGFFRTIYPLLPFSYGIDAMREVTGGFYKHHYLEAMAVLGLMFVLAFVLGMWLRKRMSHFALLFNREMEATNLVNAEKVQVVGDGYRIADVIRALNDKESMEADILRRSENYRRRIKISTWIGLAGVVVLSFASWLMPQYKALFLGLWTAWGLLIMCCVLGFEYVRKSLLQSEELIDLDEAGLRRSMASRSEGLHTIDEGDK